MYISFTDTIQPAAEPQSLADRMDLGSCIRWRTMSSGIKLTFCDEPEELVTVWVAEPTRRQLIKEPTTKYVPAFGLKGVAA